MTKRQLSEHLDMLASQLREHVEDAENKAPIPWRFDDWLTEYRHWHDNRRARRSSSGNP